MGQLMKTNFWEAGLSQPPVVDGIDSFESNVARCEGLGVYNTVSRHLLPEPLKGKWSTVLACEIIEHLPESMISATIASLEAVAKRRIIFSTPNWEYLRGGGETLEGFNELEAHLLCSAVIFSKAWVFNHWGRVWQPQKLCCKSPE